MSTKFNIFKGLDHEQIIFCNNPDVGLRAIIAIHSTVLGPALGGVRMWPYQNEEAALEDVLRLSKSMTYKSAACGLNFGGGKAVIIGDSKKDKTESLFRAFGAFIERLQGQWIAGEDVGVDVNDMEFIYMETEYVAGLSESHGGSGDPSPMTAYGVVQGMFACAEKALKQRSLNRLTVAIQGLGHVGMSLAEQLKQEGAHVIASDINDVNEQRAHKEFGVEIVSPDKIYEVDCDIFAPCAMGGILHSKTIEKLRCKIVAGSANNQLKNDADGELLQKKGILYAPDYVINAGGLVNVTLELEGYSRKRARILTRNIYYNLKRIFEISDEQNISPYVAADHLAEERIKKVSQIRRSHYLDKSQIRRPQGHHKKKVA